MKAAVEFVSDSGLKPETIVSRLAQMIGGKLTHNVDSLESIGAYWWPKQIAAQGYKPSFLEGNPFRQRKAPSNPETSEAAAAILDKEVKGLLDKGAISEVAKVTDQYMSMYFAVPKST